MRNMILNFTSVDNNAQPINTLMKQLENVCAQLQNLTSTEKTASNATARNILIIIPRIASIAPLASPIALKLDVVYDYHLGLFYTIFTINLFSISSKDTISFSMKKSKNKLIHKTILIILPSFIFSSFSLHLTHTSPNIESHLLTISQ